MFEPLKNVTFVPYAVFAILSLGIVGFGCGGPDSRSDASDTGALDTDGLDTRPEDTSVDTTADSDAPSPRDTASDTRDTDLESRDTSDEARPLPSELTYDHKLDLGGPPGAVAVGDLDADGHLDLAAQVVDTQQAETCNRNRDWENRIVVAWGAEQDPWGERWSAEVAPNDSIGNPPRNSSDRSVRIDDVNGDDVDDLVTASGFAVGGAAGQLDWRPFPKPELHRLAPVAIVENPDDPGERILRGSKGELERCDLAHQACRQHTNWPGHEGIVHSLAAGQIDGDDRRDVVFAQKSVVDQSAALMGTVDGTDTARTVDGVGTEQILSADLNRDGFDDLISQRPEAIQDLPSQDQKTWLNAEGAFPTHEQHFYTASNHSDTGDVGDLNGDGCPDYALPDVDDNTVEYLLGTCDGRLRGAQGTAGDDVEWHRMELDPAEEGDGPTGTTIVTIAELYGDSAPELLVRGQQSASHCESYLYIYSLGE